MRLSDPSTLLLGPRKKKRHLLPRVCNDFLGQYEQIVKIVSAFEVIVHVSYCSFFFAWQGSIFPSHSIFRKSHSMDKVDEDV